MAILVDLYRDHIGLSDNVVSQDESCSTASSIQHPPKRIRSIDKPRNSVAQGFSLRFESISRRWRNRSSTGPPLSIITNSTLMASPRQSFDTSTYPQRSTSHINGIYSPVSMHSFAEESIPESEVVPIYIDQLPDDSQRGEDCARATTPLLPPAMFELDKQESPIQSPLQSPSIASANHAHTLSMTGLPSPPLSARPSFASMPRSGANTATHEITSLQQLSEKLDPWTIKLGHADFTINPEPYRPNIICLDTYKDFRKCWEDARKHYAQHFARTIEHYGETSKVFRLTEEKWSFIDSQWKEYDIYLSKALRPQLQRLSDEPTLPESPIDKPFDFIIFN